MVAAQGEGVWAARLWGAAASLREELPSPQPSVFRAGYEQAVAAARRQLGQKVFAAAWAQGRSMTFEQVLGPQGRETIPEEGSSGAPLAVARTQPTYPAGFSAREVEVLRLVAQGLTNEHIAEWLVISYRTVTTHLARRVREGTQEERFVGTGDLPNFFRKPHGSARRWLGMQITSKIQSWRMGSATPSTMRNCSPKRSIAV